MAAKKKYDLSINVTIRAEDDKEARKEAMRLLSMIAAEPGVGRDNRQSNYQFSFSQPHWWTKLGYREIAKLHKLSWGPKTLDRTRGH